jgi:hypothetical protein
LDRDDADGKTSDGSKWLKARFKDAKAQLPDHIRAFGGATTLLEDVRIHPADLVGTLRQRFAALHDLSRDARERAYRELLASDEYQTVRDAMDAWCALWFWPAGNNSLPLPRAWGSLEHATASAVANVARREGFFHWELEFPDVFGADRSGFDAVLGNPPWEIAKPNSHEFFSRLDPLYRTYGKQDALARQGRLFEDQGGLESAWLAYQTSFKALSHYVKHAAEPFDVAIPGGKSQPAAWKAARATRNGTGSVGHPYRHQGSADLNTYKLFLEISHSVLSARGRLGMLVPSGIATEYGTTTLRSLFLDRCSWEWLYGFTNAEALFPIHGGSHFNPIVVQRGGKTHTVNVAFARTSAAEWARPWDESFPLPAEAIPRFAPRTRSVMEFRSSHDLEVVERIYSVSEHLSELVARDGGAYRSEYHMTNASRHFRPLAQLRGKMEHPSLDSRDPRLRAELYTLGFLPLYEGRSFWLFDPYALGARGSDSVSKFVTKATIAKTLETTAWKRERVVFRDITHSITNQRTLIASVMPRGVHGNKSPSFDGLADPYLIAGVLGSLVLDYVARMKVYVSVNWFHAATFPIPAERGGSSAQAIESLTRRLTAVGADFPEPAEHPLVQPADRLAARLVLDALVADLYGLDISDLAHIAARFPIYDKRAGDHRYTELVVPVFEAFVDAGYGAAATKAAELAAARNAAGVGFGLDELWIPPGGWDQANEEARQILVTAADPVS